MEIQWLEHNGTRIPLTVRRHRQARRISLRITPAGDGAVLTLSHKASLEKALGFARSKADWLIHHLRKAPVLVKLQEGAEIPILGKPCVILHQPGRGITHLDNGKLVVHGSAEFIHRRAKDFLYKMLQAYCLEVAQGMAEGLDRKVLSVRISAMRSRWGSCAASGRLAFNWRLVFAPQEVVHYLIAHEVAHLVEMNHSKRFWQVVARLCPDYAVQRHWLKRMGNSLYGFG